MTEKYTEKEFIEKLLSQCSTISDSAMVRAWANSKSNTSERIKPNLTLMGGDEKTTFEIISRVFSQYIVFANPYKEKGQELCDFIAILNDKVFLFSDKGGESFDNVSLADEKVIEKKWKNKCRAIRRSNEQLFEAKEWIEKNIKKNRLKIYNDNLCENPVEFTFKGKPDFFLITTLNGFSDLAKEKYLNNGSLPINMKNIQSNRKILSIPLKKENLDSKNFAHIFDIEGLRNACEWCNTPVDFMNYLKFRIKFLKEISKNIDEIKQENNIVYFYIYKDLIKKDVPLERAEEILRLNLLKNDNFIKSLLKIEGFGHYLIRKDKSILFDNIISHLFHTGKNGEENNYENEINYRNKIYDVLFLNRKDRIMISECITTLEENARNKTTSKILQFRNMYVQVIALKMDKDEDVDIFLKRRSDYIKKEHDKFLRKEIMKKGKIQKAFFIVIDHPKNHIRLHAEYMSVKDKSWN